MTTYKGTKITGTSSTAKVFKNSGLGWVQQGDWYKNVNTGHVYYCMREGYPTKTKYWDSKSSSYKYHEPATWRYDRTTVVKKPNGTVSSITDPKRGDGYVYTSTWKVPSSLTDSKNGRRASKLEVATGLYASDGKNETMISFSNTYATSKTSISFNVGGSKVKIGNKSGRNAFFPFTQYKIGMIFASVRAINDKGNGPWVDGSFEPHKPYEPTVSAPEVDVNAGVVKATVTPAGSGNIRERYQTRWQVQKKDIGAEGDGKWVLMEGTTTTDDAFEISSGELVNWQNTNHHWVVCVRARSEGWGGASDWTKWQYCGVGWPKGVTVNTVVIANPNDDTRYGYLGITNTNASKEYPVDQVVLQKLVNQPATTSGMNASEAELAAANASQNWQDTDAVDNDACTALAFLVGELRPEIGTRSYVRVKAWNDIEGLFARYSEPRDVWKLFNPGAVDNRCRLYPGPAANEDSSVNIIVAWDSKSTTADDDTTSMQLAWSDDSGAWKSTQAPEPFEFAWHDDTVASIAASSWDKSATVKVKDLEPGVTYFFQARCITEDGDTRTEGQWCSQISAVPATAPTNAVLAAPAAVPRGSDIPFSWSFSGGTEQKSWALMMPNKLTNIIPGGEGPVQSATVSASAAQAHLTNGALVALVRITTAGGVVDSAPVTVTIADPPELSIGTMSNLTEQPLHIPLECSIPGCSAAIVVSANGCTASFPDGSRAQTTGDTVWSGTVQPSWTYNQQSQSYTANVEISEGLDFWDGAEYTVEAVATDPINGLSSGTASASFAVAWSHQAPSPSESFEVDADVTVSEEGDTVRSAAIQLAAPENAAEGDVYDVYRVTGDGAELIAYGVALDELVTDYYAPFGDATHFYRVVTRTVDGDIAWRDVDYQLPGVGLRFDFDGDAYDYVELPWNVTQQDQYAKDFLLSKGMDGSKAGAWNKAVERNGRYETDVIKVAEQENVDAIRDLAKYAGAVFVRTSAGLAFAANVQVDSLEIDDNSKAIAVSFSATEIDPDDRFMATLPVEDGA